jgi:FHA domain
VSEVLRITAGNAAGAEIQLVGELLIGRAVPGDGSLGGDAELSRKHAMITRSAHGLTIEDLGSTNGTFVNGTRVAAQTPLRIGDTISIGASTLEVAGTVPPEQDTSERAVPGGGPPTDVRPPPAVPPPAPPPAPAGAPPGPPTGAPPAPPPGPPGAPPAAAAPSPPGAGGPPGGAGGPPPGAGQPADLKARTRRMIILAAVIAFLVGFGIATVVWVVL